MPPEPAGAAENKVDSNAAATSQSDARMTESVSAEPAEPPSKKPKPSGPAGGLMGAEADDYDSSGEEVITEQPMSKIARVGYNFRSGMAAVGAAAGSTTAPLLATLDAVNTFAQQARSASASGEGVALAQADGTTVADSDVDAAAPNIGP